MTTMVTYISVLLILCQTGHLSAQDPFNKTFIVTTILNEPYVMLRQAETTLVGNDRFEGFVPDLLKTVFHNVGLKYSIKMVADGSYGSELPDGTWNGMIGEVIREEADMAAADLIATHKREKVVDFGHPFLASGISGIAKKPGRTNTNTRMLMFKPFTRGIWILLIISFILVWVLLWMFDRLLPDDRIRKSQQTESECRQTTNSLLDGAWVAYKSFLLRGLDNCTWPSSVAGRILAACWMSFSLLTFSIYLAGFHNALQTNSREEMPAAPSLYDLARQKDVTYGTIEYSSTQSYFKTSNYRPHQRIWEGMEAFEPSPHVRTTKEGLGRVMRGDYVFFTDSTTVEYLLERNCILREVGGVFQTRGAAFAFPMSSEYQDVIALALLQMVEEGRITELYNKWWRQPGLCSSVVSQEPKECVLTPFVADLHVFSGPFIILGGGVLTSLLIVVLQVAISKLRPTREEPDAQQLHEDAGTGI